MTSSDQLPHSEANEKLLLGALLLGAEAEGLDGSFFYFNSHARIFDAIARRKAAGRPIAPQLIAEDLGHRSDLAVRLGEILDGAALVSDIDKYVRSLAHYATLRAIVRFAADLQRTATANGRPAAEIAEEARKALERLRGVRGRSAELTAYSEIEPEYVSWLWEPYIPAGKVTMVEGDPGVGKSFLTLGLAAGVAAGYGLPGMARREPANVLIISAEDGPADTIRPRLDLVGADCSRIFGMSESIVFDDLGLVKLEASILEIGAQLVIIDPIVAFLGAGLDMHKANEVRSVMARLVEIAGRTGAAVVIVRHLNKSGGGGKAIYRGQGSIDFLAAVRSTLLVGCDPNSPTSRAMVQIKNNLGVFGEAQGYEIRHDGFFWTGASHLTAEKMLSAPDQEGGEIGVTGEAERFLRDRLAAGEVWARDVLNEAADLGLSRTTLFRAQKAIGVRVERRGVGKAHKVYWFLDSIDAESVESVENDDGQIPF